MEKENLFRLKEAMKKAEQGKDLTIGFFGGSITQGSLATEHVNTYAYRVYLWWKEKFPEADIHYVNGGIGGTTSHFGVARVVDDLLMYEPDVVVVDFSVNDEADSFFQETYEGLLRRILNWNSHPAVILLNNVFYDTGMNAEEYHNAVGNHYGLPHISIKETLWKDIQAGKFVRNEITPDGLHPNDLGHKLVADEITAFLEKVKKSEEKYEMITEFPAAITANAYEKANRLTIGKTSPKLEGFIADSREKKGHLDFFKNGWIGKKSGDKISFEIEASCIAIQYRKTVNRPAAKAKLVIDGNENNSIILDGNFDEDWGDCLYLEPVIHHGEKKKHNIEITVIEDDSGKKTPFYLMSIITA